MGHLADTPANRKLLQNVADDPATTLGVDKFGNTWSARTLDDGTQVWTQTRNGEIINGGLNPTPRPFNPENGPLAPAARLMSDQLNARDAYRAMFRFLEVHYDRTGSDDLGALLGGLAIDEDGQPMDPAAWTDWLAAVRDITGGRDDERMSP